MCCEYIVVELPTVRTLTYTVVESPTLCYVCGDVGKVGKKIPLTTMWLEVVKGITISHDVRAGGIIAYIVG